MIALVYSEDVLKNIVCIDSDSALVSDMPEHNRDIQFVLFRHAVASAELPENRHSSTPHAEKQQEVLSSRCEYAANNRQAFVTLWCMFVIYYLRKNEQNSNRFLTFA